MSIWRIWGETGRIMASLCLITALAAVTTAVILLVHEDLTGRLKNTVKKEAGRKLGILALIAVFVWILAIGKNVAAAEAPAENSESGDPEPGTDPEPGNEPDPLPDEDPPEISIQLREEIAENEDGRIYCRADNAGIRISLKDDREKDTGIVSYCIIMADSAGKEIRLENALDSAAKQEMVIEVSAEKTEELSDGLIRVMAEAADEEGNRGDSEFSFILDTVSPVLEAILAAIRSNMREECR